MKVEDLSALARNAPGSTSLIAEMATCLKAIGELACDEEVAARDRELRLRQYAQCAAGAYCAEVAFDPVALCLRSLAEQLRSIPKLADLAAQWAALVRGCSEHVSLTFCADDSAIPRSVHGR